MKNWMKSSIIGLLVLLMAVPSWGLNTKQAILKGMTTMRATDCSGAIAEGQLCYDTDDDVLYVGNGTEAVALGSGSAPAVADTTDTTTWVLLTNDQTDDALVPKTDGGLSYNAGTGVLTATGFAGPLTGNVTGDCSGSAASVTSTDLAAIEALTCTENQIMKKNGAGAWACAADADSAGTPTVITVADTTDTTSFVGLFESATGDLAPKTDGGLTYNATTGILTATGLAGPLNGTVGATTPAAGVFTTVTVSPSADPTMTFSDSDNAAGTAKIFGNSSGGANDIIMSIGVEDSTGESTVYIEVDGVTETIDLIKPVVTTSTLNVGTDLTVTGADITLAAAGVKLTGANGALTILGLGDGQDEDVKIDLNTTANTIIVSSPASSATAVSFSALNLATTGTIQGGIAISSDADGMDAAAMTAAGMYGTMFIATGAGTWILPRAALGMSACLMDSGTAHDLILDVTAGSTIRLKGAEGSDGVGITNASGTSTGDFICVIAVATDKWSTVGMQGTWASQ